MWGGIDGASDLAPNVSGRDCVPKRKHGTSQQEALTNGTRAPAQVGLPYGVTKSERVFICFGVVPEQEVCCALSSGQ